MTAPNVIQFLILSSWFLLSILIALMLLIARFYQNVSGERTFYWLFGMPIVLFGIAAVRYAFIGKLGGDTLADLASLAGGLLLALMCIYLYNLMTAGR